MHHGWVTPAGSRSLPCIMKTERLCIKHSLAARRMESGIRPVTEECNQSAFYYVLQQGPRGRCGPYLTRHSSSCMCVMHACFDFFFRRACMCLDECPHIPLIRYTSALHACMLSNVFRWENVWTTTCGVCHTLMAATALLVIAQRAEAWVKLWM